MPMCSCSLPGAGWCRSICSSEAASVRCLENKTHSNEETILRETVLFGLTTT